jgi:hypothetical protein
MNTENPIVGIIVVTHRMPRGVIAQVDGQTRWFRSLDAVFRAALALLDAAVETTVPQERKGP